MEDSGVSREAELARVFVVLADTLVDEFDVVDLLTTVTQRCVDLLGAEHAAVRLLNGENELELVAASSVEVQLEDGVAAGSDAVEMPMHVRGNRIGVLTVRHAAVDGFTPDDLALAQAFADVATLSVVQHRTNGEQVLISEQLTTALATRVSIEQAKGVIVGKTGWPMEQAFAAMRGYARSSQRPLLDVAADVVSGLLPPESLT